MLAKLIVTNATEIARLKKDIATESYITDWHQLNVPIANVTGIDNRFKQALFANWVRDTADFPKIKAKYKSLAHPSNATHGGPAKPKKTVQYVIANHNLTLIREQFGVSPINVQVNESYRAAVIVPRSLQLALFDEWPQKSQVIHLLGKFAKDMDLSVDIVMPNGTRLVLRPSNPPPKKQLDPDYRYINYGMQFINRFYFSFFFFFEQKQ